MNDLHLANDLPVKYNETLELLERISDPNGAFDIRIDGGVFAVGLFAGEGEAFFGNVPVGFTPATLRAIAHWIETHEMPPRTYGEHEPEFSNEGRCQEAAPEYEATK